MSFDRIIISILLLICILYDEIFISSYSIRIKGGERSCYFIKTIVGVPITGSYEVILPDPDFISVEVRWYYIDKDIFFIYPCDIDKKIE